MLIRPPSAVIPSDGGAGSLAGSGIGAFGKGDVPGNFDAVVSPGGRTLRGSQIQPDAI